MPSERVQRVGFSPTLAVSDLARRLRAEGVDVLDFSAGQPDFPTPDSVKDAAKKALDENLTGYTANAGVVPLRETIARRIASDAGAEYAPEQILVSPGAKASLYFAFMALLNDGDEVVVPVPYWTSYPEQVRLAGGEPVFVDCPEQQGFKLDAQSLERAITERTRAVILNYPSNPTGASYSLQELRSLAEVCLRKGVWVIADEIYSRLLYDGRTFASIASIGPEVRERTLIIDGVSKTYSMTGWRIGYAAGPSEIVAEMGKVQSHSTSNATSISQWASVEALGLPDETLEPRRREFERRRDEMLGRLRALPGVECVAPEGAFYVFPNVSGCFTGRSGAGDGDVCDGHSMARYLLEKARVAVVPGEAFGARSNIRLSYATSMEKIREGMDRIALALEALSGPR